MALYNKERDDAFLNKLIRQRFPTALMNNHKWVKLITVLVANYSAIKECRVKIIWDDETPVRLLLIEEDLQFGLEFYDTSMEALITGNPKGWYQYKEIEWLDFPRYIISNNRKGTAITEEQDLEFIKSTIEAIGQFHLELTSDNLRLYAYLRG